MGEETKPEEQAPVAVPVPAEGKTDEKPPEENPPPPPPKEPPAEEGSKEEEEAPAPAPQPPPPFVLYVDLHCVGCAKKIERSIMKIRGVEGVVIEMAKNQVTIKGVVEPNAICNKIMKKTKRMAKVLSPLPANQGEPIPELVTSQVSGLTTVELNVNMHCEACAAQLKKKILQMRGVQTAETELSSGKVTVTGTMDANKLVEYVYRRTKKQAKIVPQPEPEKPVEEPKPDEGDQKPAEEPKPEENNNAEAPKEAGGGEENKPEETDQGASENKQDPPKKEEQEIINEVKINPINYEEETMKRMMYHPQFNYYNYQQPMYMIERIPPPQLFSDENPNACCIS